MNPSSFAAFNLRQHLSRSYLSSGMACAVLLSICITTVSAQVTVSAPIDGSVVNSPVLLQAQSSSCSSQATGSMAYSIDDGVDTIFNPATSINTNVTMPGGAHTLHVKAWGNQGALCMKDLALNVGNGVAVSTPTNGSTVTNPFNLQAQAPSCGGQGTSAMAWSVDDGSDTIFNAVSSINTSLSTSSGSHTLRVKAWGNSGAFCETDLALSVSAVGAVVVATPSNNATVSSPFPLQAQSSSCQGQTTGSMAYSLDSGTDTVFDPATSINTSVTATQGTHTLHVKAWGNQGALCMNTLTINVTGGDITVTSPTGTNVTSPFTLQAQSSSCQGLSTGSMAYSIDSGTDTIFDPATSINTSVSVSTGTHILHVKAWNTSGGVCVKDLNIDVVNNSLQPPSNAQSLGVLELDSAYNNGTAIAGCGGVSVQNEWQTQHDCGSAPANFEDGSTSLATSPTLPGHSQSRQFHMTYSGTGGAIRWFDAHPNNSSAFTFQYDVYVFFPLAADVNNLENLELDVNQALDGTGVYIFGAQCFLGRQDSSGQWVGVWQVSSNGAHWINTNATCSQSQFAANSWHHIQVRSHRDLSGGSTIFYDAVAVDGSVSQITSCSEPSTGAAVSCTGQKDTNATGWSPTIGPNFQLDGRGTSGAITAYANNFQIYWW